MAFLSWKAWVGVLILASLSFFGSVLRLGSDASLWLLPGAIIQFAILFWIVGWIVRKLRSLNSGEREIRSQNLAEDEK
jgi:amino acid permease